MQSLRNQVSIGRHDVDVNHAVGTVINPNFVQMAEFTRDAILEETAMRQVADDTESRSRQAADATEAQARQAADAAEANARQAADTAEEKARTAADQKNEALIGTPQEITQLQAQHATALQIIAELKTTVADLMARVHQLEQGQIGNVQPNPSPHGSGFFS